MLPKVITEPRQTIHLAVPQAFQISLNGAHDWLTRPAVIGTAVACAVLFSVLNAGIVAIAAHLADPEAPLAKVLWDRESLLLDLPPPAPTRRRGC
jgi:hypothetical protein